MRRLEALRWMKSELKKITPEYGAEAMWAVCRVLSCEPNEIYMRAQEEIDAGDYNALCSILESRTAGEPLAYILKERWFMGRRIAVAPGVLIPRNETELLCEAAAGFIKPGMRALDLCTGSGCIAISLALDARAAVTASDISEKALEIAEENAKTYGADINFVHSDMFENIEGKFDIIVSNPPYVTGEEYDMLDAQVRCYEPRQALIGGKDGLCFYRIIAAEAPRFLRAGGALALEIGCGQAEEVTALLASAGFCDIEVKIDYSGRDRIVSAKI